MVLPSAVLLEDTLSFLTFLHADDIKPRMGRFLTPRLLVQLDQCLLVPDRLRYRRPTGQGGRYGTTERETERIRFLHWLCESAHLIALTDKFLKPTPLAARWLTCSVVERSRILFDAFRADTRRADELWQAYALPGFKIDAPHRVIQPLLTLFRQVALDQSIQRTTLLKLIPIPKIDGDPADKPMSILTSILRYLDWLGVIRHLTTQTIQLTDLGADLLGRSDAPRLPDELPTSPLKLNRQYDLVAAATADFRVLYELADYADCISIKPHRTLRLSQERVQRALEHGETSASILRFLENAIDDALPRQLVETIQSWAQHLERVTLRRVTLLETQNRALLEELTRSRTIRKQLGRTLSSRAITVRENGLAKLIRQLKRFGVSPRVEFSLPSEPTRDLANESATFHLYIATRLGYLLSDLIPAHLRTPYSIVQDLEQQLSEHERNLADGMLHDLIDQTRPFSFSERSPVETDVEPITLEQIQNAIDHHQALVVRYYTAARDETTTRTIEPLRMEWRNQTPYLIAYCRLRQDERVFRVDRILEIGEEQD